jgi:hypothetical protein
MAWAMQVEALDAFRVPMATAPSRVSLGQSDVWVPA